LIDDWTHEAVQSDTTQVVILGTGFDCIALHMAAGGTRAVWPD
jgi:O-methyltransferase involved in polyketide biosynthesis